MLAKAPKLAEGTRINDALVAAVAQVRGSALGAARIVLLTDGDDVGATTSLDSALAQLDAQKIRVFTVGIESPDFTSDDLQKIADRPAGPTPSATSPEALTKIYDELGFQLGNEYLLRYRSTAQPDQDVDVSVTVKGTEPVSFAYTIAVDRAPQRRTSRRPRPAAAVVAPRFRSSSCSILALVVFTIRSLWSLRSNKALVARLGDFVTLPAEEQAAARRKEVDVLLAVGEQREEAAELPLARGVRRGRRRRADRPRPGQDDVGVRARSACSSRWSQERSSGRSG